MLVRFARRLPVLLLFVLSACGGGGGGGDSGTGSGGGTLPPVIALSQPSVTLENFVDNASPDVQQVDATFTGGAGSYYALLTVDHPERFTIAQMQIVNGSAAQMTFSVDNAVAANLSGVATYALCSDAACAHIVTSVSLPYAITNVKLSTGTVAANAAQSGTARQVIAVSPPEVASRLEVVTSQAGSAAPAWLSGSVLADAVALDFSATGLDPATYSGQAIVRFHDRPTSQVGIPVTLTVGSAITAPPPLAFALTSSATSGSMHQGVTVQFAAGVAPAWTADADVPWLRLDAAAGQGSGSFGVTVDTTAVGGFADWSQASGHVTIHGTGLDDLVVPVTLDMQLPLLTGLSTPVIGLGGPTTLILHGRGLAQNGAIDRITVEGGTITARSVASDTVATVTLAALAPGRHQVAASNASGIAVPGAIVAAVDPASPSYAFISASGGKRASLFDSLRGAVFTVGYNHDFLTRFMQVNGTWQVDTLAIPSIDNLALSFDHATLYVTSGTSTVVAVDPDTLTVRSRVNSPLNVSETISRTNALASTADGRVWLNQFGGFLDTLSGTFDNFGNFGSQDHIGAPTDGSRLFLGQVGPGRVYTTSTQSVASDSFMPEVYTSLTLSADAGRRIVDWSQVYDGQWAFLGSVIERGSRGAVYGYVGVPSADGTRVYALFDDLSNSNEPHYHVGVFDTNQYAPGTTDLLEIGQIALPDQAQCVTDPSVYWCDLVGALMIGPFDNTLYWAGDRGLVVIPIPANLAPAAVPQSIRLRRASAR